MAVSLSKGQRVSLNKEDGGELKKIVLGLGWDPRQTTGEAYDLDASAFVLGDDGKVLSDGHFVFFNNREAANGCVKHLGDNLTGAGEGDDEQIEVDLANMPLEVSRIVFTVTIHLADERKQNFGDVDKAFIRVVDAETGKEEQRYDLGEDFSLETAVKFGEVYRHGSGWKFRAVGDGYNNGLAGLAKEYGVNVG